MDSSSAVFKFLTSLPVEPSSPESVADLLVLAFNANDKYYVCYKNGAGEFRQHSHDLPPRLHNWLFPSDGATRDLKSLQVILNKGDDFFASDSNGRISSSDPTSPIQAIASPEPIAPSASTTASPSVDVPVRQPSNSLHRRSLTQQPDPSPRTRAYTSPLFRFATKRSQPEPQRARSTTRPPLRLTEVSSTTSAEAPEVTPRPLQRTFKTSSASSTASSSIAEEAPRQAIQRSTTDLPRRRSRPLSMSFAAPPSPIYSEIGEADSGFGSEVSSVISRSPERESFHGYQLRRRSSRWAHASKVQYADAGVQTDPVPELERKADRGGEESHASGATGLDGEVAQLPGFDDSMEYADVESDYGSYDDVQQRPGPFRSGGMMESVWRPGYQLGDMLTRSYYPHIVYLVEENGEYFEVT